MPFNPNFLSDSIQLSVAPVFLLTAVAGMISALTQRIARVIDRSRDLQLEITKEKDLQQQNVLKILLSRLIYNIIPTNFDKSSGLRLNV